ncbi:L,D-transpeptidase family protein [Geodermatophilus sp. CPCC 205506]|uniref:L,D-transpeptidase family protein n=1 Tax=Geodermatophilus sp. CPCC 205506 TaxID=2936596 RepID=UPI003EF032EC
MTGEWGRRTRRAGLLLALVAVLMGIGEPRVARAPAAAATPVGTVASVAALTAVSTSAAEPVGHRPGVGVLPRPVPPAAATAATTPVPVAGPVPGSGPEPELAAGPAQPEPAAAPVTLPLGVDPGGSTQVVTVVAPSSGSTTAQLTAWELGPAGWTAVLGPVRARLGSAGVGAASESSTRTPAGTHPLTEAFGRAADPGSGLPYRVVDDQDWWVSDVASPLYNQHTRCAAGTCPFDESVSENLLAAGAVYDSAVVIDYNRGGRPGAGSAFFLHVTNGAPTAGCVAIDRGSLRTLLQWLDAGASPLIAIGVG